MYIPKLRGFTGYKYMDKIENYKISLFGEFTNKSLENEFLADSRSNSAKATAYIALVFGLILILFLVSDYFTVERSSAFLNIALIRILFVFISIAVFFLARQTTQHTHLIYLITMYQAIMAIFYLLTLKKLAALNYFSVFALMVISLAIYLLPNKIMFSQATTVIFSILFFLYPAQKIEDLQLYVFYRMIAYQIILLIYCNIKNCSTEIYKRKIFVANRELLALSVKDPLTGVYNRNKFDDEINKWINISEGYGNFLSLIVFDIDDFKKTNDQHGHLVGDSVIKNIVATINKLIRNTDVFARWGGDEFVILLPNTNLRQAEKMAERMKICISNDFYQPAINITCSFGVATYEKGDTTQSLLNKADDLLLQAKISGKDRVVS